MGDTKKETDRWIDKDSSVLYCISSNDDRDSETDPRRFEIEEHSLPSSTKPCLKNPQGVKMLNSNK